MFRWSTCDESGRMWQKTSHNIFPLHWRWGLNSNYGPGLSGLKLMALLNIFMTVWCTEAGRMWRIYRSVQYIQVSIERLNNVIFRDLPGGAENNNRQASVWVSYLRAENGNRTSGISNKHANYSDPTFSILQFNLLPHSGNRGREITCLLIQNL
jgi:hypothetical protein